MLSGSIVLRKQGCRKECPSPRIVLSITISEYVRELTEEDAPKGKGGHKALVGRPQLRYPARQARDQKTGGERGK